MVVARKCVQGLLATLSVIAACGEAVGLEDGSLVDGAVAPQALSACGEGDSGKLLSYELVASYPTKEDLQAFFDEYVAINTDFGFITIPIPADIDYGADTYKVTYCTLDANLAHEPGGRQPVVVTGNLTTPRKSGPKATVLYTHGTSVSYYDAPSNPSTFDSFDGPPATSIYAGGGFIFVAPDFIGLGDSVDVPHRYLHATSEASSTVDLWHAAKKVMNQLNVNRNNKLFIMGFSAGGHAALATQRLLEEQDVMVTATATTGGVFDAEAIFSKTVNNDVPDTFLPLYGTYALVAYDKIYDVYSSTSAAFREPYASRVNDLFNMQVFFDDVAAGLGPTMEETLKRSYFNHIKHNPNHEMRVRLRQNAVDDWSPNPGTPMREYHSPGDEEVDYDDTVVSLEKLRDNGADMTLKTMPATYSHYDAWYQAMPKTVTWFRSF